ncbi:MAG: glucose-1-phosphate cytidylyltransferase [Candidatus Omnitrophica bacterium]|nr:glucose-1-phosphate cytidylyltransferase [Candidatus Omnitrophota bacterium]
MKVVILCGGQGTRMREETEYRPKPLAEIGGRPILWHIMKAYAHFGFTEFVLCLGYRGNMIKEYFLNYHAMNSDFTVSLGSHFGARVGGPTFESHSTHEEQNYKVTLADTGLHTMTGGRIKKIKNYVKEDSFIVTYGDGVADIDIRALIRFHEKHGKIATVTTVQPVSRFGVLDLNKDGEVVHFAEKPKLDGWVNAGFMVFNKKVFDCLQDDSVLEQEPLQKLAKEGQLVAYRHDGFFYAMDTYREYQYLNDLWEKNQAPWKVWK